MNDYNKLSKKYKETHEKLDKKYSMLPTVLSLSGDLAEKEVIDVGCGDGFFTVPLARKAKRVIGIDNSSKQIERASRKKTKNIRYILADMNTFDYPSCDLILAPFVINYLQSSIELLALFKKFYHSLRNKGKMIGIIEKLQSPHQDMQQFGSIKKVMSGKLTDGEFMQIELYKDNKCITTLEAYYWTKLTLQKLLKKAGFLKINWHTPTVSEEGLKKYSSSFWKEYIKHCDVAYFIAEK